MDKVAGLKGLLILVAVLGFLADFGCSRQVGVPAGEGTEPATERPFHDDSAVSPNLADSSSAANYRESGIGLPFHDAQSLPAGTLLMVRLKAAVSTAKPQSTDSFEATLDAPVMVGGSVLIPRGSDAVGRIESARTSQMKPGRGYIQLALQSIRVGGVDVPVQTASLFVRQPPTSPKDSSSPAIRLEKGHRLTFRLIQPLYAANQSPQITR